MLTSFQIKESPEGDWNIIPETPAKSQEETFKLKNPRKGTETTIKCKRSYNSSSAFKLKNPRKGTETWKFSRQNWLEIHLSN